MAIPAATRRIVLLDLPRMLADLVREIVAADDGLEVVGEGAAVLAAADPDFVIVGGDGAALPESCRDAFDAHPHLTVLALTGDGRHGDLWSLAPRHVALGEVSADTLLTAMRAAPAWSWDA